MILSLKTSPGEKVKLRGAEGAAWIQCIRCDQQFNRTIELHINTKVLQYKVKSSI